MRLLDCQHTDKRSARSSSPITPHPAHNPDGYGSRIKSDNTVWDTRRTQIGNSQHLLLLKPRLICVQACISLLFRCSLLSAATRSWSKSLKISADFPVACSVIAIDPKLCKVNIYISFFSSTSLRIFTRNSLRGCFSSKPKAPRSFYYTKCRS